MDKYVKFDDIDNAIRNNYANANSQEIGQELFELYMEVSQLPTIEVSEDAISREWVLNEIITKVEDDDSLTDEQKDSLSVVKYLIRQAPLVVPSVVPQQKEGEWLTKTVKKFCAPDCWYPGTFAIEGSWNEEEGSWLEEQDGFCSECGKQDEHHNSHKYCPNCGTEMGGKE